MSKEAYHKEINLAEKECDAGEFVNIRSYVAELQAENQELKNKLEDYKQSSIKWYNERQAMIDKVKAAPKVWLPKDLTRPVGMPQEEIEVYAVPVADLEGV